MDLVAGTLARPADQRRANDVEERRRRLTRWTTVLPLLAVLLGIALRVRQWWAGASFWLDELFIVEQLLERDYSVLATEPLGRYQSAPVGWLWSERLVLQLFGDSEQALRLPSLLCGSLTLVLVWRLANRLLPDPVVFAPVLLTALSPVLIRYSNEVKQYPLDVVLVVAVVLAAARVPSDRPALRPVVVVAALGAVAVWFSMASVFALGAVSAVLVLTALRRHGFPAAMRVAAALSPWLMSFALAFTTVLQRSRENAFVYSYWGHTFPAEDQGLVPWLQSRSAQLLVHPLGLGEHSTTAKVLLLAGAVALVLRAPIGGSAVLGTVCLGTVAAAAGMYPLADRLALWLLPLTFLVLSALLPGVLHGCTRARTFARVAWLVAVTVTSLLVASQSLETGLRTMTARQEIEEMRDLLEEVDRQRRAGDVVLSAASAVPAVSHYGPRTGVIPAGHIMPAGTGPSGRCDDARALADAGFTSTRVWVVVRIGSTEYLPSGPLRAILPRITTVATPVRRIDEAGVYAVLFEPRAAPVAREPSPFCARLDPPRPNVARALVVPSAD